MLVPGVYPCGVKTHPNSSVPFLFLKLNISGGVEGRPTGTVRSGWPNLNIGAAAGSRHLSSSLLLGTIVCTTNCVGSLRVDVRDTNNVLELFIVTACMEEKHH